LPAILETLEPAACDGPVSGAMLGGRFFVTRAAAKDHGAVIIR
jgi:hypothetical protein